MNFVFPGFLFALSALAVPLLIHLFRFRRFKTVYFPNIAFLRQLSEASDRESRLKHILVLIARMLAIAFLVIAFSRPYIPSGETTVSAEGNVVGVYIDNSFSMSAMSSRSTLLEEARNRALEISDLYGPADRFLLQTNDFEGRHQRLLSRDEFREMVLQVGQSARIRSIGEVMTRKEDLFGSEPAENKITYYLSDFQKSTSGFEQIDRDHGLPVYFLPLVAQRPDNLFVDSVWMESPVILAGQPVSIGVRVGNEGDRELTNQSLRLFINGQQRTVVSFDADPGGEAVLELGWSAGSQEVNQAYVSINDHPVSFDDRMYFTYRVDNEIPVLAIEGGGRNHYLDVLYGRDELFDYQTMPGFAIDHSSIAGFSLVVLDALERIPPGLAAELERFVRDGGSLAIFPGRDAELGSYNDFLNRLGTDNLGGIDTSGIRVNYLNDQHLLFEGVFEDIPENIDLPYVSSRYPIRTSASSTGEELLRLQNGMPLLSTYTPGSGRVMLSAVPLSDEFSTLQRHSVFVPLMVNLALQSGWVLDLYHTIGDESPFVIPGVRHQGDRVLSVRSEGYEVIPEQRRSGNMMQLFFHGQVEEAGNYSLYLGDTETGGISFNYDRRESRLESYDASEMEEMLTDMQLEGINIVEAGNIPLKEVLSELGLGRQLWRLFIILALLSLLIEIALLRFLK